MFNTIERYVLDVVRGNRTGVKATLTKVLLLVLSWPFQLIVTCRNRAFDKGWLRCYFPPVPLVISIGNIVAGGTGKTPVTLLLANEFYAEFSIAILSRGYRSKVEKLLTPIVLSKGEGPMHPASYCGDEPFLLAKNLPKALVFVGKDRHKASYMAAKAGAQVILLDDGMQHRRLARDLELIVLDMYDPFGKGYFLPRGFLRESVKSLGRADLIILNHVQNEEQFDEMRKELAKYCSAPVVGTKVMVSQLFDFSDKPLSSISGKKVGIFCGIAHPDYFQETISNEGAEVVSSLFVSDHSSIEYHILHQFAHEAKEKGAEILICTEKDRVKITELQNLSLPLAWIQMKLNIVAGHDEWNEFVNTAKHRCTQHN